MSDTDVTTPADAEGKPLLTPAQVRVLVICTAGAVKLRERLINAFDEENHPKPDAKAVLADVSIKASKAAKMAAEIAKSAAEPHLIKVDAIKAAIRPIVEQFNGLERDAKAAAARIIEAEAEERRRAEARARAEQEEAKRRQVEAQRASLDAAKAGDLDAARTHEVNAAEAYMDAQDAKASIPTGAVPNMISGASGSLFGRQDWGWDVEDLDMVPEAFTLRVVSEKAVDAHVEAAKAAGKEPSVPGLRFYSRTTMVNKPAGRAKKKG